MSKKEYTRLLTWAKNEILEWTKFIKILEKEYEKK